MQTGQGTNRYATLPVRDLVPVQVAHLRTRFELAERSFLAEQVAVLTNRALMAWEQQQGSERLLPGELLLHWQGQPVRLPLLRGDWSRRLAQGLPVTAVLRHLEYEQVAALQALDPEATVDQVWRLLQQTEVARQRGPKNHPVLPDAPLDASSLPALPRRPDDLALPPEVLRPLVQELQEQHGCRPAQAEGLVQTAAQLYVWCCPRVDEVQPGQVVWLAHAIRRSRRTDPRLFVPVVLTLLTPEEMEGPLRHRGDLKALKMRQVERITAEAWRQDAVLTALDLEWLLGCSAGLIRELLERYHEHFGVLLPTAGTVLDMGRTLTHKTIVVELSLAGHTTQEIARRIYHTPESVDQYLRLFDRVLLLRHFGVPARMMGRITGHSPSLIQEHLALADKHFPDKAALEAYLTRRGISPEELRFG